jgi:NAD(P)-dependent dehydrogenase (short-subunit alcohol dehydrogenase family)
MSLPSFRLDDRVALVTGGSSGIGREIALGLALAPAETLPAGEWRQVIDVDLTGVFLSCQAEGRALLRRR